MNLDIIKSLPYVLVVIREYSSITYGFGAYDALDSYNSLYEFSDQNNLIEKISEYEAQPKENWHAEYEYKLFTNENLPEDFQELINNATYEKVSIRKKQEQEEREQKKQKSEEEQLKRDLKELERLKNKLGI